MQPPKSSGKKRSRVVAVHAGGAGHEVVTIVGGNGAYRRKPCPTCPWRKDMVGEFPAEAFRVSAHTAYDMAESMFGCHTSGKARPSTCAGFLLNGSANNMAVRLALIRGSCKNDVRDGGHALHASYREMAVANGVNADDPVLVRCRE